MFLLHLGARHRVGQLLRQNGASSKFQALFDTKTCPHGDTLNATYRCLDVIEVQEVVTRTMRP